MGVVPTIGTSLFIRGRRDQSAAGSAPLAPCRSIGRFKDLNCFIIVHAKAFCAVTMLPSGTPYLFS